MTDSFGTSLRQAREQQQISLADIAARTKIKASLFEQIERDDASHWPSGIFRRSFMREYAHAVGLNAEETVREFLRRFPDPADPAAANAPSPAPVAAPAAKALAQRPAQASRSIPHQQPPPVEAKTAVSAPRHASDVRPEPPVASDAPVPVASQTRQVTATAPAGLRLTLVETGMPFAGGRLLADVRRRWCAAAWDGGSLLAIAISAFVLAGSFWMPLAVAAACYYVGGVLLLGNTPGVCLFAPRPKATGATTGGTPVRAPRPRHVEAIATRHGEPAFRARRWSAKHSELST